MDLKTLIINTSIFFLCVNCCAQCHLDDWTALKSLYESTNGDEWEDNDGWEQIKSNLPPEDCDLSKLNGVTLDEDYNTRVERLSLPGNNIIGSIPDEISSLSSLKSLSLFNNKITGSIPHTIGKLENLISLDIAFNFLEGSIPSEFENLNKLERIYLFGNKLSGEVSPNILNLENIARIYLNDNQLTGRIPEYNNPNKSIFLFLHNNQLTGSIPSVFGNVRFNAQKLTLFNNNLSGCFDENLSNMCDSFRNGIYGFQDSISEGNDFDATWREFCYEDKGICDTTNVCQPNNSPPLVGSFNCD